MSVKSKITGILVFGVHFFGIERRIVGEREVLVRKIYPISLVDKVKAQRRIQRLSKMIQYDLERKWENYVSTDGKETVL